MKSAIAEVDGTGPTAWSTVRGCIDSDGQAQEAGIRTPGPDPIALASRARPGQDPRDRPGADTALPRDPLDLPGAQHAGQNISTTFAEAACGQDFGPEFRSGRPS